MLTAEADATETFLVDLYERQALTFDKLEDWLRANTAPFGRP